MGHYEGHRRQDDDRRRVEHNAVNQGEHVVPLLLLRALRLRHSSRRESETLAARGEHLAFVAILIDPRHGYQGPVDQDCVQYSRLSTAQHSTSRRGEETGRQVPIRRGLSGLQAAQDRAQLSGTRETVGVHESEESGGVSGTDNQKLDTGRRQAVDHVRGRADAAGLFRKDLPNGHQLPVPAVLRRPEVLQHVARRVGDEVRGQQVRGDHEIGETLPAKVSLGTADRLLIHRVPLHGRPKSTLLFVLTRSLVDEPTCDAFRKREKREKRK